MRWRSYGRSPSVSKGGKCGGWTATHDHTPPGPATLRVTGKCEFGSGGYRVELRPYLLPGSNPKEDLLLELIVEEPTGFVSLGFKTLSVSYEEKSGFEYKTVTILTDSVTVPVEEVH